MFNFCCLSGRVCSTPTLKYFGKDKPVTKFTLEILEGNARCGTIKVQCYGRLAVGAVKHLSMGDRIAIAGFISGGKHRQDNGTYQYELRLVASELAPLREDLDMASEPSGEDLLS
jgi:single-strand DNA-binding protein